MADLPPPLDAESWRHFFRWLGLLAFLGFVGRLAWHARQVGKGNRRFWSFSLLWEVPVAILCGLCGGGLAEYVALGGLPAYALVAALSYLGPGVIEAAARRYLSSGRGQC